MNSDMRPDLLDELRSIQAEHQRLGDRLQAVIEAATVGAENQLLLAIYAATGNRVTFAAADVFRHAEATENEALRSALVLAGAHNPKKLGKRLSKLAGEEIGGLCVDKIGETNDGFLWHIVPVKGFGEQTH